ncbi:MAG: MBL fold metallo-hydrolase, partial [Candidatus Binatia bacterium]
MNMVRVVLKMLLMASLCLAVSQRQLFAQDKMNLSNVAENIYLMENSRGSGNSSFVITDEGVVVFDTDIRTSDQTLAAIRKLTDKKVRYVITSHSAGDHATGGWHFREDNPVYIATKNQAKDLFMQEGKEFEERKAGTRSAIYKGKYLVRPDIAFTGNLTLYLGGMTFQMTDEGHGHSTSDLTVYVPQRRVMLTGDILDTEIHPGQGESGGVFFANVQGWIDILDRIINR